MYDMYPWDKAAADDAAQAGAAQAGAADTRPPGPAINGQPGPAIGAVQVALDRRDNGGDAAAQPGKPTASPARQ